jgi:hypothetical protein
MLNDKRVKDVKLGAIYKHEDYAWPQHVGELMRLVSILPCEGVWMETVGGGGYGDTIKFDFLRYASLEEVEEYVEAQQLKK